MGYALAGAARHEGHRVTLISGPCDLDVPEGVDYLPVETAAEMYGAVERYIAKSDIAIFAAAVADYRPAHVPEHKIKKTGDTLTIDFIKNPDILGSARTEFGYEGTLIGFAAETENVEENARGKLQRKGCDFVVANDVSRKDIGFDSSENEVMLVFAEHTEPLPKDDKYQLSLDIIARALAI